MGENLQGAQVIAKIFDVSVRRVEQLNQEGIIKGQGRPIKYDLLPTIKAYIKFLSDKAYGRDKKEKNSDLEKEKLEGEARIKQAKAEMAELELEELRGELHSAEDVEDIITDHVLYFRSMLMAVPGKLAVDLAGTHTAAEQADRVKKEINYILECLADYQYDPDEYKKRVRERQGWKEKGNDEE